uniref:Uncharacterized protein n=1 Tax=Ditylum brightwellii TaxID=49249 RepID=A0A7S4QWC8_9STRA
MIHWIAFFVSGICSRLYYIISSLDRYKLHASIEKSYSKNKHMLSTMKVLSSAFFVLFLQVSVEAFTFVSNSALSRSVTTTTGGPSSRTVQRKHHLGDDVDHDFLPEEEAGSKRNSIHESNPINVVLALGLALTLAHAPFQPSPAFAADQNVGGSGAYSTLVLSAIDSIKDADIVDFSMPSYESAARAEVNSNLKGDKYLLGEASKNYESSSSSSSSSSTSSSSSSPETAAASVVDEKADKAAAKAAQKAAQKAARAQQQAAVEEAAKAAAAQ